MGIALYTQALKPFLHIFWTLFLIKKKRTKIRELAYGEEETRENPPAE